MNAGWYASSIATAVVTAAAWRALARTWKDPDDKEEQ